MYSIRNTFFVFIAFCSIHFCKQVSSDEVPAVLWNIKGNSLQMKPVSALGSDDDAFDESLKDILPSNANILIFAVNELSLEDFSLKERSTAANSTLQNLQDFLDIQRYMFLSSVKEPLSRIHKVHCGVQEIVVDRNIDDNVLQSISQAFDRSCVVILHIADTGVVGTKDPKPEEVMKIFQPTFEKTSKNIVGVFTATKSSWGNSKDERHIFRNLLQAEDAETPSNFINITGCILTYANNATLKVKEGNNTSMMKFPPKTDGSQCGNSSSLLQLNFETVGGEYTSVIVKFNFSSNGLAWKTTVDLETSGGKPDVSDRLMSNTIEASLGYSFSCGRLMLNNGNSTNSITLIFERFQVEPFTKKDKFSDSFDCVTWFTIPIWMGIFVSLLFIAIINCGVYALFSVHTMDRFDDPKGKTISVSQATE